MDKIITVNLSDNIIQNIADYVEENFLKKGKDTSKLAFVFGGRRPSLFLKKELADKIGRSFLSPRFFSIDEFVEYAVSKNDTYRAISELDASFIIYRLARKMTPDILGERNSYAQFLPWAGEILSFIGQLDLEGIQLESLENVQSSANIGYDVPDNINILLKNIISLRKAFHDELKKQKLCSRGMLYLLAAQYIQNIQFDEFENIFFCNFFYLHKTEEQIIKSMYSRGNTILFFQGSRNEWLTLNEISRKFSCRIQPEEEKQPDFNLSLHAGFDVHSQVSLVGEILKKIKNLNNTVIVLPEPDNIIPLLSQISSNAGDFNVSLGYPLRRSSIYSLFENMFNAQVTRRDKEYYTIDYLKVLSNPLIKNLRISPSPSVTRVVIHKIEEVLKGIQASPVGGSLFISLDDIANLDELYDAAMNTLKGMDIMVRKEELKRTLEEIHDFVFLSWEEIDNFYTFSLVLEKFLAGLINKSFLSIYPLNLKVVEKIFLMQKELQNLTFNKEEFSKEEIFKIFKDTLAGEMISFSGSPLKGLQVLGLFETRSLGFENVIIMDMNESVLPKLRIHEPLIPREVMLGLGLNRLEKEQEIQHYHFKRLISSAKNVHLIFEENKEKGKSRFIEELIWQHQKQKHLLETVSMPLASFNVRVLPKKVGIEKNQKILEHLKNFRYSASSIDTYMNCPLKFYYQYVLRLGEKEDLLEEPEAREIGSFIHELLFDTFKIFINKKPNVDEKFRDFFFKTLIEKFDKTFKKRMKSDSFLIKEVVNYRMEKFLNGEQQREVKNILHLEEVFEEKITLSEKQYYFKAVIDRIDKLEDESILVIDYKTGGDKTMSRNLKTLESLDYRRESIKNIVKSFQIPLYLHFVEEKYRNSKINAALYNLRTPKLDIFFKEKDFENKEKIKNVAMKALESLINEISNPEVLFKADEEDPHKCSYCSFSLLCR